MPCAKKYISSNFENQGNKYKGVTIPMSNYQGQFKGARFSMKIQY